jgi:DNA-binding Lrp family transcriptional regulator
MDRFSEIDSRILRELLKDGRAGYAKIAGILDLDKNLVFNRFEVLKRKGIIIGATTQVNIYSMGFLGVGEIYFNKDRIDIDRLSEIQKNHIPDSFFAPDIANSCTIVKLLRNYEDLRNVKYLIREKFPMAEAKTCTWGGMVMNIPENLSFGLPDIKSGNESNTLKLIGQVTQKTPAILDAQDRKMVELLTENGRISFRKLAELLKVTTDTVSRRYKKLEENGLLKVVIQINPEKIGYNANLELRIEMKSGCNPLLAIQSLCNISDVFLIYETMGDYDLHVFALIKDIKHMFEIKEQIETNPIFAKIDMNINKTCLNTYPYGGQSITTIR